MKREFRCFKNCKLVSKFTPLLSNNESILIFVPGYFSASSIGPNRIFVEMENALMDKCSGAYRLDWPGMGDNTGDLADYTFPDLENEFIKFCKLIHSKHDLQNVSLIAHSMGCAIVGKALKNIDQNLKNIIFLSPASSNQKIYESMLGEITIENGCVVRKGIHINADFLKSVNKDTCYNNGLKDREIRVIYCKDDPFICSNDISLIAKSSTNSKVHAINSGGHNYITLESKNEAIRILKSYGAISETNNRTNTKNIFSGN